MSTIEILTLSISGISLLLSLWASVRTNQVANNDLRMSNRSELHSLLHSLDQMIIEKPELSVIYESYTKYSQEFKPPSIPEQNAYILMQFNLFELAFSLFKETRALSKQETEIASAWENTTKEFFYDCTRSVEVWNETKHMYYLSFQKHIDILIVEVQQRDLVNV
jgi:hypothetical protein